MSFLERTINGRKINISLHLYLSLCNFKEIGTYHPSSRILSLNPRPIIYLLRFIALLAITFPFSLKATHLAGGELTYRYIGPTPTGKHAYDISLRLFRDCSNAQNANFDTLVTIYAFRSDDQKVSDSITIYFSNSSPLSTVVDDTCSALPQGICYEVSVYTGRLELFALNAGYDLVWMRCCRNSTLVNLLNPGNTGTTLTAHISGTPVSNSSPTFVQPPQLVLCLGRPFTFFQSATDVDGDSLRYSLVSPYAGGGPGDPIPQPFPPPFATVNWAPGFTETQVLGAPAALTLQSDSGKITTLPTQLGQYCLSIAVRESRNQIFLSEVRRDFQINVLNCNVNIAPVLGNVVAPVNSDNEILFYAGQKNCLQFQYSDNVNDFVVFSAEGDMFGNLPGAPAVLSGSGYGQIQGEICWEPNCELTGNTGKLYIAANDNNKCPAPNFIRDTLNYRVVPPPIVSPTLRCLSWDNPAQITLTWLSNGLVPAFSAWAILGPQDSLLSLISDSTLHTWTGALPLFSGQPTFRIETRFDCPTGSKGAPSEPVLLPKTSSSLQSLVKANITWPLWTGWADPLYSLYQFPQGTKIIDNLTAPPYDFVECDYEGAVQIQTQDPITGCISRYVPSETFRLYLPPPDTQQNCRVTVLPDDSGIVIFPGTSESIPDQNFTPAILRRLPGENSFQKIQVSGDPINGYQDLSIDPDLGSVCYLVGWENPCKKILGLSDPICSVWLDAQPQDKSFQLSWTPAQIKGGVNTYDVYVSPLPNAGGTSDLLFSQPVEQDRRYAFNKVNSSQELYCFRVIANANLGACGSYVLSNESCHYPDPTWQFPNAFTPNGDGINDYFFLPHLAIKTFQLQIWNRLGELVYSSVSPDAGWDGMNGSKACPEGIYVFKVEATGHEGQSIHKNGTIMLIR